MNFKRISVRKFVFIASIIRKIQILSMEIKQLFFCDLNLKFQRLFQSQ